MNVYRRSPLDMGMKADRTTARDGWNIAETYLGEKRHNLHFITDLSHVPKWVLHGHDLDRTAPLGISMPAGAGEVTLEDGIMAVRLTPIECRIMNFGVEIPELDNPRYTELTDGVAMFSVVGPCCLEILNKLSAIDLSRPGQVLPCAAQAPVEEITCLIVHLTGVAEVPGIIISGARGYGPFLVEVFLDAGREFDLAPAGVRRFNQWFWGLNSGQTLF